MKKILIIFIVLSLVLLAYYFSTSNTEKSIKTNKENTKTEEIKDTDMVVNYEVKKEIFGGKNYLAVMFDALPMEDISGEFFAKNYAAIGSQIAKFGNGEPSALFYVWDTQNKTTKMAIAIPLEEIPAKVAEGFKVISVLKNESFYVDYYGSYAKMENAHESINEYIFNNNLKGEYVAIEEYVTDPATEPDPNKWLTKISYVKL